MSPSILLVPVEPLPPTAELDTLRLLLARAFDRTVRVTEPVRAPAAARLAPDRFAIEPIRAAIAASWGCGCRDRLVGVTAARLEGEVRGLECGGVCAVTLSPGASPGPAVRAVGRSLGLGDCPDPGCVMHPCGDAVSLCCACRARC